MKRPTSKNKRLSSPAWRSRAAYWLRSDGARAVRRPVQRAIAAVIGVVDEHRLEHPILVGDEQVVHDAVAEIRREHFARLRSVGDEAHRTPWAVGARAQFALQCKQPGLRVEFEGERVGGVALVAPATPVKAPERRERKNVRADHRPLRTARAWLLLFLLSLSTLPLLKLTFHALFGLLANELEDQ